MMPQKVPTFRPPSAPTRSERRAEYDRRRGTAAERGYTSKWTATSLAYRARHPLCVGCLAVGRTAPADVVDHIVPHRGDKALFWDRGNWQGACTWHHDAVKARLEDMFDAGQIGADALRLDSEAACELTRDLDPTCAIGETSGRGGGSEL